MNESEKSILQLVAHAVRALSADAIEKQQSGHPGLPLGAAEIGAYLFCRELRHNPANPNWMGRDRFVLSAGHGSMLLYSLLHLCGYGLTIQDLQYFRQLYSRTPGHPEYGQTPGVETTTGPLGQGVAAGTGMAIAQKLLSARFGADLFNAKIWILAGDGCMMEGISSEAGSLAGTLGLNNLVIIYDANEICLDGPTREVMVEDTARRYEAYGFQVITIDGYDFDQIEKAFSLARREAERPTLIIAKTVIGRYAPTMQGKSASHGKPLGPDEMKRFKAAIGWPEESLFHVPEEVRSYFLKLASTWTKQELDWDERLAKMKEGDARQQELWNVFLQKSMPHDLGEQIWNLDMQPDQSTRKYNERIVEKLGELLPFLITGSADVSSCDFTWLLKSGIVAKNDWDHQQIKFGVREFCMAACAYGMNLHGMIQPVVGTFLVFSDYMRNAIRMAALMKQRVLFVFSHDSVLLAQDGPTHQPVEQLMSLRMIPNMTVIRPGDENEAKAAWMVALAVENGPVALCFTRQPVPSTVSALTAERARIGVARGAYALYGEPEGEVDVEIFATGSEIHPAVGAAQLLEKSGKSVRVISVPSWELLDSQDENYKKSIKKGKARLKTSVEAGIGLGWQFFVGRDGLILSQESFGASAPEEVIADHFGFTAEKIYQRIITKLRSQAQKENHADGFI
jgi:transketolase